MAQTKCNGLKSIESFLKYSKIFTRYRIFLKKEKAHILTMRNTQNASNQLTSSARNIFEKR